LGLATSQDLKEVKLAGASSRPFPVRLTLTEGIMFLAKPFRDEALVLSAKWFVRKANRAIEKLNFAKASLFCKTAADKLSLAKKREGAAALYSHAADYASKANSPQKEVASLLFAAAEEYAAIGDVKAINTYLFSASHAPQDLSHRGVCRQKAASFAFELAEKEGDAKDALHLYQVAIHQSDSEEEKRRIAAIALPLAERFLGHCVSWKAGIPLASHHVKSFRELLENPAPSA